MRDVLNLSLAYTGENLAQNCLTVLRRKDVALEMEMPPVVDSLNIEQAATPSMGSLH
jgi:hypothetical protein